MAKKKQQAPEELKFLRGVTKDPEDDFPRLAYADWLAERSDPRGEFIHVQCELAQLDRGDDRCIDLEYRERDLLARYRLEWARPLGKWARYTTFRRGFPETLTVSTKDFLESGKELLSLAPILHVRLTKPWPHVKELAKTKLLGRLRGLNLRDGKIGLMRLRMLLTSSYLKGLRDLELGYNGLALSGVRELCDSKSLSKLTGLGLSSSKIDLVALEVLLKSKLASGIQELRLNSNPIDDDCLRLLAGSDSLEQLRKLTVEFGGPFRPGGLKDVVENLPALEELSLRDCGLSAVEMMGFANSSCKCPLRSLDLDNNWIESQGAARLAESSCLEGLVELTAAWSRIGNVGLRSLLNSGRLKQLRTLRVRAIGANQDAVNELAKWKGAGQLTCLDLTGNKIGDSGAATLAQSKQFGNLNELHLEGTKITDKGARLLAESPHLSRLTTLRLTRQRIGAGRKKVLIIKEGTRKLLVERFGKHVCHFYEYEF